MKIKEPSLRAFWVQVHLWLGLTLGVLGMLIGISGSILVFDHDIDAVFNPQRYAVSGPQVTLRYSDYLTNAAQSLESKAKPTFLRMPEEPGMPVVVIARARGEGGGNVRMYMDPPTGRVLDTVPGGGFFGWLHSFHENLTLREYYGRETVGAVGIAMLLSSLSGLYLWWPARGRWREALGFRRGLATTRNLHYVGGFYGFIVLAMLSFTGIFIAYTDAGRAAVAAFTAISPPARNIQAPAAPEGAKALKPDAAVDIAKALYPAETVWSVGLPNGARGAYRVNLSEPGVPEMQPARGAVVFIDPYSGNVLRRIDASTRTAGDNFLASQRNLHSGERLGIIGRIIICLAGLLPLLFVITGTVMWLKQRRVRAGAKANSLAAAALRT
ncbi:MAG TPA: PepSY-associated TM helix domain-containing protein [Burkholderiales bacterium]|nr:PepSY-associated TM helix domain-containing protein [Burkholderiales bacterium]